MMNFLSRYELNKTYGSCFIPYVQNGELPYLATTDYARLLSLDEIALLFGFEPADLAGYLFSHRVPYLCVGEDLFFERKAILRWYLEEALPLLEES